MSKRIEDPLAHARTVLLKEIEKNYPTVEQFCWDKNLNKATISNLLNNKKDFRVSTLMKIASALGRKLVIEFEK